MRASALSFPVLAMLAAHELHAQSPAARSAACEAYTRDSTQAPSIVRTWLARSTDTRVLVCTASDAEPVYSAESSVTHEGGVCSFASRLLVARGAGARRQLRADDHGAAVHMALGASPCPPPHTADAAGYVETFDVSAAVFESLMQLWRTDTAAASAFDRSCESCTSAAALRLRRAIEAGHVRGAPITRMVRIPGGGLKRRYELIVADPQRGPAESTQYVIYLTRWVLGPWRISGVADSAD